MSWWSFADGRELKNSLKVPRADFADDTPETLSRGERHRLRFVGPPLGAGEAITLEAVADLAEVAKLRRDDPFGAEKKLRDSNKTLGRSREVGATSIDLNPQILASMSDGPVTLQWSRAVERKLQDATPEGGTFSGQYLSAPRTITLTE